MRWNVLCGKSADRLGRPQLRLEVFCIPLDHHRSLIGQGLQALFDGLILLLQGRPLPGPVLRFSWLRQNHAGRPESGVDASEHGWTYDLLWLSEHWLGQLLFDVGRLQ